MTYSPDQLKELRRAVRYKWLYGTCVPAPHGCVSRKYNPGEKDAAIEAAMKEHMAAGRTAADLLAAELNGS